MLRVLVYPIGLPPREKEIVDSLETMQEMVGGFIEVVDLGRVLGDSTLNGYLAVLDEEGKLKGLPLNRLLGGHDVIVGQFFVTKDDGEGGFRSLSDLDIECLTKRFG